MSNINPFILTGMMPLSASSMNRVSYMCPVTISNDVEQGQTDIQDSLTVDSGGNLYIINAPVYVGGPNQPDHGHRTAHLVIRNGGAMTLLGNLPDHMTVFLGDKANGSLEINGGRLLMGQGRIQGAREHEGRIAMTDGWLFASEVDLPAEGSELVIRHGLMRIRKLSGNASTRIYGGVLHVKEEARASRIHLIDDGVLLLGCKYGEDYQCHFIKGSEICNRRKENIAETLNRLGVQPERVDQLEVAIDEYDKVPDMIDEFVARIVELGPNPFKGM